VHRTTTHSLSAIEVSVVSLAPGKLALISPNTVRTPYLSAMILAVLGEAACRCVEVATIEGVI
jgi:hypothetical protein